MSKQIIVDVFNGKKVDRVPVSFWYHFCPSSDFPKGVSNPGLFKQTVEKHIEHFEYLDLDLLKVMPDGYFTLPSLKGTLEVVTADVITFTKRLLEDAGADGIFFAVRNYKKISKETYRRVIAPGEKSVLDEAAAIKDLTILHICGGFGLTNDFSYYEDYNAKAVNWAAGVEKLSLGKGKEVFKGKAVIGGFDNTAKSILINGTKEEIQTETRRLIKEAGKDRVIIGADCALPTDKVIPEKLKWVREAADEISKEEILPQFRA